MGKAHSRIEDGLKQLAEIEAKGDPKQVILKLKEFVRICQAQGALEEAVTCLDKLLNKQEENFPNDELEIAKTKLLLGNTIRLQLQGVVVDSGQQMAFVDEKERTKAYARAEHLLISSLEAYESNLKKDPENKDIKMCVAQAKSALALIENSYGGRLQHAQKQHEEALDIFAEFPLKCDQDGWTFSKGVWSSSKLGITADTPQMNHNPHLSLLSDDPSFRIDSRPSNQEFRSYRATTGAAVNNAENDDQASVTDDDGNNVSAPPVTRTTKWRLVIRFPRSSERRPSLLERLRKKSLNKEPVPPPVDPNPGLFEGIIQKIDLEPGTKVEVGAPLDAKKKAQLEKKGITYISIGPKEKISKFIAERHCVFEEDHSSVEDYQQQRRWVISDSTVPSSKLKGILVNGIRVNRAPLRAGDVVQIGNCSKVKVGSTPSEKSKSKDIFANGIEYTCERVITTIEDTDISQIAPPALEQTDATDAFKYFNVLAVGAQINLNGPPLKPDQIQDLFTAVVKGRIPFNLWDSWVYAELSKMRLDL